MSNRRNYFYLLVLFSFELLLSSESPVLSHKKQKTNDDIFTLVSANGEPFKISKAAVGMSCMLKAAFYNNMQEQRLGVFKFNNFSTQTIGSIRDFLECSAAKNFSGLISVGLLLDETGRQELKNSLDYLVLNEKIMPWIEQEMRTVLKSQPDQALSLKSFCDILPNDSHKKILRSVFKDYSSIATRMLLNAQVFSISDVSSVINFNAKESPCKLDMIHQEFNVEGIGTLVISNKGIVVPDDTQAKDPRLLLNFPTDHRAQCYYFFYELKQNLLIAVHYSRKTSTELALITWDLSNKGAIAPKATFHVTDDIFCCTVENDLLFIGTSQEIQAFDLKQSGVNLGSTLIIPVDARSLRLKMQNDCLYIELEEVLKYDYEEGKTVKIVVKKIDMGSYFRALQQFKEGLTIKDILLLKNFCS